MHTQDLSRWTHRHEFGGEFSNAEKNTRRVLLLTAAMMAVEIVGGLKFRSMALLADGWHMGTHVAAFAITALAYWLARRHQNDPRFSFGTGKIGVLGAFTSAIILGGVAVYMAGESILRFFSPTPIAFSQAIPIACVGLAVNVVSALLLKHEHPEHDHEHGEHHPPHHDLNFRAAYVHVLADAVTSLLAITALVLGKFWGWSWLDPLMGFVGSLIIAQWARSLIQSTNPILLDREPRDCDLSFEIRKTISAMPDTAICDLHIWQIGAHRFAAIVSLVAHEPQSPEYYKRMLGEHSELVHLTVEVNRCDTETRLAA